MRLLLVTQVVDNDDPVLGFFHQWIEELAGRFSHVIVICLKEGTHMLPDNVRVYSLGKENGSRSRISYAVRFLSLVYRLRREYDAVLVHMNQEYVLIAGWLWKILGKRTHLWRNHYAGSFLTDIAAVFCAKVFCTSRYSYTARYRRTIFMPVGVDAARFSPDGAERTPRSILFLARMSPSKRAELLIEALALLKEEDIAFEAALYGEPAAGGERYYETLKEAVRARGLEPEVRFKGAVKHEDAPGVFRAYEIFVNCSPSGMLDKTLFEAAASGTIALGSSKDWEQLCGVRFCFDATPQSLADKLAEILALSPQARSEAAHQLGTVAKAQDLAALGEALVREIR